MVIEIGQVEAIFRYPVKSTAGERIDAVNLGSHVLDGDRRLAFRRIDDPRRVPMANSEQASRPAPVCSVARAGR
jgi:uncharacterized protein YcbX